MKFIPERLNSWHNNLSERFKLFYYGVLGNLSLAALDLTASIAGGDGSIVNGIHNAGDVAAYGLRALVADGERREATSKKMLLGANLLALSLTSWFTLKSGLDLVFGRNHLVEPSAAFLEVASSLGNFAIARALADNHDEHGHGRRNDHPLKDGHHHAKTDAWASLIATGGLSLAASTGDSLLDSLGTLAGGAYFIWHMAKHMRQGGENHAHNH
jgi:divalent metal cation (Fe/Co/Zn/Cd) transporter